MLLTKGIETQLQQRFVSTIGSTTFYVTMNNAWMVPACPHFIRPKLNATIAGTMLWALSSFILRLQPISWINDLSSLANVQKPRSQRYRKME